jgi:hypothetical protein
MKTPGATMVRIGRIEQAELAASPTSVRKSRRFARQVCSLWQWDGERTGVAELLISELASNAIQASGFIRPRRAGEPITEAKLIGVRLLELRDSLVIEVRDSAPEPPVLLPLSDALEEGRGLQLVDALSIRWGHYRAPSGKVVFCELARSETTPGGTHDDAAACREVAHVLQSHAWQELKEPAR